MILNDTVYVMYICGEILRDVSHSTGYEALQSLHYLEIVVYSNEAQQDKTGS